jgi:hypothetical protein
MLNKLYQNSLLLFLTLSILFHGGFAPGTGLLLVVNNAALFIALSILLKVTW